jgi:hypothetical protein
MITVWTENGYIDEDFICRDFNKVVDDLILLRNEFNKKGYKQLRNKG